MPAFDADMVAFSRLRVCLSDIAANYCAFVRLSEPAAVAAVVKADAYGLGAVNIALHLWELGCQQFYSFTLEEAVVLRKTLPSQAKIYFLGGLAEPDCAARAVDYRLIAVLNRECELRWWRQAIGEGFRPLCVHVDSGMQRLGLTSVERSAFCQFYHSHAAEFEAPLIVSHLACAENRGHPKNQQQLADILAFTKQIANAQLSLAATCGVLLGADFCASQVRVGIGLYGSSLQVASQHLCNPLAWRARILQIRRIPAGQTIGYGATPIHQDTVAAIIGIGYADGLRRCFGESGRIYIGSVGCPMLGRISMDCAAIDVSAISDSCALNEGDEVEILGSHQSLDELAIGMQSIAHETLTAIGPRVRREFC